MHLVVDGVVGVGAFEIEADAVAEAPADATLPAPVKPLSKR